MVTKKASKPLPRLDRRGRASALNAPRRRVHALAPEHVGELGSVAALVIGVLGVAVVIIAISLVVSGLTMHARYATGSDAQLPPDIGQLGLLPVWGGIGLTILGLLLVAGPVALLADVRGSRLATVVVSLLAGILAVGGLLAVAARPTADPVLVGALGVAAFVLGASALLLARPGR